MIEWIRIKNFKCFTDFKIENFSRINFITGANNVGKTALLEAIAINSYSDNFNYFFNALKIPYFFRYKEIPSIEEIIENFEFFEIESNIHKITIKVSSLNSITRYNIKIDDKQIYENKKLIDFKPKKNPKIEWIELKNLTEQKLQDSYGYIQLSENEALLNNYLNEFDNNIKEFKFIDGKPMLKTDKWVHLNEFGDGMKSFIFIICGLFKATESYMFIDEIENGIWYKKFSLMWKIIEDLSKELNVQIFATTHSIEVIKSLINTNYKDISLIELGIKNEEVYSITYNYECLKDEIEQNHEVRGW